MSAAPFVHLRLHSEFSIVDSTLRIGDAVALAAKDDQFALAITDLNNLFGFVKFYKAARSKGIKPICGVDVWIDIEADGFLYNMVRNIVGTLKDIGADRFGPRWMVSALAARERMQTDLTAPARGLCLMQVNYPENLFVGEWSHDD